LAGYCKIDGDALAYDGRLEGLTDRAYRLLHFIWHGPGRTMIGARRFHPRDALARNPHWALEQIQEAMGELIVAGLAFYDQERAICYCPLTMEHQPPTGPKVAKGAATRLQELPESPALIPAFGPILACLQEAQTMLKKEELRAEFQQLAAALRARLERIKRANPDRVSIGYPGKNQPKNGPDTLSGFESGRSQDQTKPDTLSGVESPQAQGQAKPDTLSGVESCQPQGKARPDTLSIVNPAVPIQAQGPPPISSVRAVVATMGSGVSLTADRLSILYPGKTPP